MVIRKVFHYDKDAVTAIFSEFDRRLSGDNDNEEYYNGNTSFAAPFSNHFFASIP